MPKLPRNQARRRITTGIWEDMEGGIHYSLPELLAKFNLPDTLENRLHCQNVITLFVRKHHPQAIIVNREKPD